jgi:putative transposase
VHLFKKSRRVLCQGIHAKYVFMKQQRKNYSIVQMAQWLRLSRSGYYAWLQSKSAQKHAHHQLLEGKIHAAHAHVRMTYGPRRLQKELSADDVQIGLNQLRYLRRRLGLRCIQARKFKATTNSNHSLPVKDNLLGQSFEPVKPNEMWVSDISYIPTAEG